MRRPHLSPFFVKLFLVSSLIVVWQLLSWSGIWSPLIFPDPIRAVKYYLDNTSFVHRSVWASLKILFTALFLSSIITFTFCSLATISSKVRIVLETLLSMLAPIPGISLLPFAMLWFGLGYRPILFVTVTGALAVYMLPIMNGLSTVSPILLDVGRIYGFKALKLVRYIYLPATLPSVLTGVRAAWGLSWRSLIAAELVFGAIGQSGGIGWLISVNRYNLNPNGMIVGIIAIVIIGFLIEHLIMGTIERHTVVLWGMKR